MTRNVVDNEQCQTMSPSTINKFLVYCQKNCSTFYDGKC